MMRVAIQSLTSGIIDAKRLATKLGVAGYEIGFHRFPDGELRVTVGPAAPVTIVYAPLDNPNDKLVGILIACEALRRNGAERLVLVAPYMCYMRQDTAFHANEGISQRAIGRLLAGTFDRVITVDAHLHRTRDIRSVFPGIEAENVSAVPAIADALRATGIAPGTIVVGPDEESRCWVGDLASRLGRAYAVGQKVRRSDRSVAISFTDLSIFAGRPVLIVDDIVSSGGTLIACASALVSAGASAIDVIITHALFSPDALPSFASVGIRSVRSTHSVPHPTNAIMLDDVLMDALHREIMAAG
ncbi:ribose-phosphate diphosphokinase [Hyphomicrobium sp. 99]|uniref:ribose-phosphate diphosphokinase n=1 Tax=Hyphomicrobium sp. 99 TaxID=1163419 RepID=UPI0012E05C12|nr:ribose-phosphate diphosphokinase [Hyphomicrobium sp. 99]